jgi:hypothetical protein
MEYPVAGRKQATKVKRGNECLLAGAVYRVKSTPCPVDAMWINVNLP